MKDISGTGHIYEIAGGKHLSQVIDFMSKEQAGTTNEELIEVLIHRLSVLNAKLHCPENAEAIIALEAALDALDRRTRSRAAQGVEGTELPHFTMSSRANSGIDIVKGVVGGT